MGNSLTLKRSQKAVVKRCASMTNNALFVCKDGRIPVNKDLVLKYCRPLTLPQDPSSDCTILQYDVHEYSQKVVTHLVTHIYGNTKERLDLAILQSLLALCIHVKCESMIKKIAKFGMKIESPISAHYFYSATYMYPQMNIISNYCYRMLLDALPILNNTVEFNKIGGDVLVKLFSDDIYKGENKHIFLNGILAWLYANPDQRQMYEQRLFQGINVLQLDEADVYALITYDMNTRREREQSGLKGLEVRAIKNETSA